MKRILNVLLLTILFFPLSISASIKSNYDSLSSKIDNLDNSIFLNSHPIGSIYMTINPDESTVSKINSKYGGTWKVFASGKILIGYSSSNSLFNNVEQTGGEENTTLSISNLPRHSHSISHTHTTPATTISSSGAHTHKTASNTLSVSGLTLTSSGEHTHGYANGGSVIAVDTNTTLVPYSEGFRAEPSSSTWWPNTNKTNSNIASAGSHTHTVTGSVTIPSLSISSSGTHTHTVPSITTNSISTATSESTGSGISFTNLSPYITIYMYKRIS